MIFFCESVTTRLGCALVEGPWQAMLDNTTTTQNGFEAQYDEQQIRVLYRAISQDLADGSMTFGPVESIDIEVDESDERVRGTDESGRSVVVFERYGKVKIRARSGDDESPTRFMGDVERIEEGLR